MIQGYSKNVFSTFLDYLLSHPNHNCKSVGSTLSATKNSRWRRALKMLTSFEIFFQSCVCPFLYLIGGAFMHTFVCLFQFNG